MVWSNAETNPWIIPLASMQLHPGFFFRYFSFITLFTSSTSFHCPKLACRLLNRVWYPILSGSNPKAFVLYIPKVWYLHGLYKLQERTPNPTIRKITIFNIKAEASFKFSISSQKIHNASVMIQIMLNTKYAFHGNINFTPIYDKTRVATSRQ